MRGWCGLLSALALLVVALPGRAAPPPEDPLRLLGATRPDLVLVLDGGSRRLALLKQAVRAATPSLRAVANLESPGLDRLPVEAALSRAGAHLLARRRGTSPFVSPDPVQSRPRLVVLVLGSKLSGEERAATRSTASQLRAAGLTLLEVSAEGEASAAGLARALTAAVFSSVAVDYPSGPGLESVDGTVVLLPSFEHPGWRGHLRAIDLASPCRSGSGCHASGYLQRWDARDGVSAAIERGTRRLYTASMAVAGGQAIPVAAWAGRSLKPCITGAEHAGCAGAGRGVRDVWRERRPAGVAELAALVEWLVRRPLGPILRSVPASVGPPPGCAEPDHAAFAAARRSREPLVYVASTDGIVHALRARTGEEVFGWVPAELWPKLRERHRARDEQPARFEAALTGSPRVEDARSSRGWRTELTVRLATTPEAIAAIDVSDPGRAGPPFTLIAGSEERVSRARPGLAQLRPLEGGCLPVGAVLAAAGSLTRCQDRACAGAGQTLVGPAETGGQALLHAPAVLPRAGGELVAALSGSAHQAPPGGAARIFLRSRQRGGELKLDLPVGAVCKAGARYAVRSGACPSGAPRREALPVTAPLLLESRLRGAVELFALFVEPDPARSWLIQIRLEGSRAELQRATLYERELTGMTVAGGQDLVFSAVGRGPGRTATLLRRRGGPVSRRPTAGAPIVESVREVP